MEENKELGITDNRDGTYTLIIPPSDTCRGMFSILNKAAYEQFNNHIKQMCKDATEETTQEIKSTDKEEANSPETQEPGTDR